jgi:protein-S-isoprenylcysteine O-methyltransferase Ste14
MYFLFFICVLGAVAIVPIHFLSVGHVKLQAKYGKKRGNRIGEIYGVISGWGFFLFWTGIWISSQPRFAVPIFQNLSVSVPATDFSISAFHLIIFIPLFAMGAWLGIKGVKEITLKTAETHKPEKIVATGIYSLVRHPQYLGGLLAHMGISFLLSAWYSLLSTPLMTLLIYLISKKEEQELIKEFGKEYEDYKKRVPMLIPRLGAR